jgi:DNA (cytosine-5)-methyltransferase 1
MKQLGLYAGVGGFEYAASMMGWETVAWCESDVDCQLVLRKRFPKAIGHGDIMKVDFTQYANTIDILTGGFPCQTFSVAGKGTVDLTLWKEMFRAIREIKPPFVVAENVPGILGRKGGMAFDTVCADLESEGYEVIPCNIPVAGAGAPHKRARIWFIAYSDKIRRNHEQEENGQSVCDNQRNGEVTEQGRRQQQRGVMQPDFNIADNNKVWELQSERCEQDFWKWTGNGDTRVTNNPETGLSGGGPEPKQQQIQQTFGTQYSNWSIPWPEVAAELCRVDDGIPKRLDRRKRIEQMGNAISPVLALRIFKGIEYFLTHPRYG